MPILIYYVKIIIMMHDLFIWNCPCFLQSQPGQTIVQAVTGGYNVINIAFWMATGMMQYRERTVAVSL